MCDAVNFDKNIIFMRHELDGVHIKVSIPFIRMAASAFHRMRTMKDAETWNAKHFTMPIRR